MTCEGCGLPLNAAFAALVAVSDGHPVCMGCVRARHRAVVEGRCRCGRQRREIEVKNEYRWWMSCQRCLGFVRGG